jgi:uncharacterized membrane protein
MYTYLRSQGFRTFMLAEAPCFLVAFLIATTFYKFGSLGLELVAFIVTWTVLSAVGNSGPAYLTEKSSTGTP